MGLQRMKVLLPGMTNTPMQQPGCEHGHERQTLGLPLKWKAVKTTRPA